MLYALESIPRNIGEALLNELETILVVLPTLGQRIDTLEQTLQSIAQQRNLVSLRLIVVTPATSLEAISLCRDYGAEILVDPGMGISHAINIGIQAQKSETYYAWMGDDDLFRPNGLRVLLDLFATNQDALVAYGACDYIDPDGEILATNRAGKLATFLLPWGPDLIPHPGSLIKLQALNKAGKFNVKYKYAMDLDMFLRLMKMGKFISTKISVSAFRWHPDSLTVAGRKDSGLEAEEIKRSHLPRPLRFISPIWMYPVRWASIFAANSLNRKVLQRY